MFFIKVSGETYTLRTELRRLNFWWNSSQRLWECEVESITDKVLLIQKVEDEAKRAGVLDFIDIETTED